MPGNSVMVTLQEYNFSDQKSIDGAFSLAIKRRTKTGVQFIQKKKNVKYTAVKISVAFVGFWVLDVKYIFHIVLLCAHSTRNGD